MRLRSIAFLFALLPATGMAQTLPEQVLELVNVARRDNGQLPPLKGQVQLDAAAQLHSANMATRNFFNHQDPGTGTSPGDRITAAGYAWATYGENIAAGNSTAAATMAQWMASSGHRANILGTSFNEMGNGYGANPASTYRHYWTQVFGRRSGVYPLVIAREAYQTGSCAIDLYVYGAGFATQMRFSNNAGATWSPWQTYSANTVWNLAGTAGGIATVHAEIRNGSGSALSASDSIRLTASCGSGGTDPMRVFLGNFEG